MRRGSALPALTAILLAAAPLHAQVAVTVEGQGATLYSAQPNVSDEAPKPVPDIAICTLPCSAKLSTETSYLTLGADGASSRAFRISALTRSLTVRQGSQTARAAGIFGLGLGGVAFGAGLGLFITHAIANADNNPSTAETAGTLALPLLIGGAVSMTLGLILYAISGTSVRDQEGRSLAGAPRKSLGSSFSFTE